MGLIIKRPSSIYAIRCKMNGKVYVGRSENVERRAREHFAELKRGYKRTIGNGAFQADFDRYGINAFEVYILEKDIAPNEVEAAEIRWIREYRSTDPVYGYNRFEGNKAPALEVAIKDGLPPKPDREAEA